MSFLSKIEDYLIHGGLEDDLKSVGRQFDNIVQGLTQTISNDPLKAVATAIAINSGQWWALPTVQAVSTLSKGGDLQDALESFAKTAAIQYVTSEVSNYVSNTDYVKNLSSEISKAVSSGTEVPLGNFTETTYAVGPDLVASGMAKTFGSSMGAAVAALATNKDPVDAILKNFVTGSIGTALSQTQGFRDLPSWAKTAVATAASAGVIGTSMTEAAAGSLLSSVMSGVADKISKQYSNEYASQVQNDVKTAAAKVSSDEGNVNQQIETLNERAKIPGWLDQVKDIDNKIAGLTDQQKATWKVTDEYPNGAWFLSKEYSDLAGQRNTLVNFINSASNPENIRNAEETLSVYQSKLNESKASLDSAIEDYAEFSANAAKDAAKWINKSAQVAESMEDITGKKFADIPDSTQQLNKFISSDNFNSNKIYDDLIAYAKQTNPEFLYDKFNEFKSQDPSQVSSPFDSAIRKNVNFDKINAIDPKFDPKFFAEKYKDTLNGRDVFQYVTSNPEVFTSGAFSVNQQEFNNVDRARKLLSGEIAPTDEERKILDQIAKEGEKAGYAPEYSKQYFDYLSNYGLDGQLGKLFTNAENAVKTQSIENVADTSTIPSTDSSVPQDQSSQTLEPSTPSITQTNLSSTPVNPDATPVAPQPPPKSLDEIAVELGWPDNATRVLFQDNLGQYQALIASGTQQTSSSTSTQTGASTAVEEVPKIEPERIVPATIAQMRDPNFKPTEAERIAWDQFIQKKVESQKSFFEFMYGKTLTDAQARSRVDTWLNQNQDTSEWPATLTQVTQEVNAKKEGFPDYATRQLYDGNINAYNDDRAKSLGWPDSSTRDQFNDDLVAYQTAQALAEKPPEIIRTDVSGVPATSEQLAQGPQILKTDLSFPFYPEGYVGPMGPMPETGMGDQFSYPISASQDIIDSMYGPPPPAVPITNEPLSVADQIEQIASDMGPTGAPITDVASSGTTATDVAPARSLDELQRWVISQIKPSMQGITLFEPGEKEGIQAIVAKLRDGGFDDEAILDYLKTEQLKGEQSWLEFVAPHAEQAVATEGEASTEPEGTNQTGNLTLIDSNEQQKMYDTGDGFTLIVNDDGSQKLLDNETGGVTTLTPAEAQQNVDQIVAADTSAQQPVATETTTEPVATSPVTTETTTETTPNVVADTDTGITSGTVGTGTPVVTTADTTIPTDTATSTDVVVPTTTDAGVLTTTPVDTTTDTVVTAGTPTETIIKPDTEIVDTGTSLNTEVSPESTINVATSPDVGTTAGTNETGTSTGLIVNEPQANTDNSVSVNTGSDSGQTSGLISDATLIASDENKNTYDLGNGFTLFSYSDGSQKLMNNDTSAIIDLTTDEASKNLDVLSQADTEASKSTETPTSITTDTTTPIDTETSVDIPASTSTVDTGSAVNTGTLTDTVDTTIPTTTDTTTNVPLETATDVAPVGDTGTSVVTPSNEVISTDDEKTTIPDTDVTKEITTNTENYNTVDTVSNDQDITEAVDNIDFPTGISKEDVAEEIKTYMENNPGLKVTDVTQAISDWMDANPALNTTDVKEIVDAATTDLATKSDIAAAIDNIDFPIGISKEDVADEIKTYMDANPGLQASDVSKAIADWMAENPALTTTDVSKIVGDATANLVTDAKLAEALGNIKFPEGISKDDVTGILSDYMKANPGLSLDQVVTAVKGELENLPDYATPEQLTTAIDTATTGLKTEIEGVKGEITDVESRIQAAIATNEAAGLSRDAAITKSIDDVAGQLGTTKDDLLAQMGTTSQALRDEFSTGLSGVQETLSGQIGLLSQDAQDKYDALSEAQKAEVAARLKQGDDLELAISDASSTLGEKIETGLGGLETRLNEQGRAILDQLEQQGVDYQTALETAISQQQEATETAIGGVSKELTDVQKQFNDRVDTLIAEGKNESEATKQALAEIRGSISGLSAAQQQASAASRAQAASTANQSLLSSLGLGLGALGGLGAATAAAAPTPETKMQRFVVGSAPTAKFEGPLEQFLKMSQSGYTQPAQPEKAEEQGMNYYSYGQPSDINLGQEEQQFAAGGMITPLMAVGGYAPGGLNVVHHSGKARIDFRRGAHVAGPGDGQSDDIPAMLADGEFVFPADVVSALGNGSTKAGSDKLYKMMHEIRARARSSKPKDLPPPALKSPLEYLGRR